MYLSGFGAIWLICEAGTRKGVKGQGGERVVGAVEGHASVSGGAVVSCSAVAGRGRSTCALLTRAHCGHGGYYRDTIKSGQCEAQGSSGGVQRTTAACHSRRGYSGEQ